MRSLSVRSIAGQVFAVQVLLVGLLVVAATTALILQARNDSEQEAVRRATAVAQTFATSPGIASAMGTENPTAQLQPRAEETRKRAHLDFVVVANTKGIRYTHPRPEFIGKELVADWRPVVKGKIVTESVQGPLGREVQATVPIPRANGTVAGVVCAGMTAADVSGRVERQLPLVFGSAAGALALATGGTALVGGRLRRQTRGLGPAQMTRMYEHHDAVLHSVREGVLIVDSHGRLVLANDEAGRLLDLPRDAEGRPITELGLEPRTAELLASGRVATDEVHLAGDRLLAINQRPTRWDGGMSGSVATLRDSTELRALSGKAEVAERRLRLLFEAGSKIGTTLDIVRTAEELTQFGVPWFADFATVDLVEPVLRGDEPTGNAMRRTATSGIRADHPLWRVGKMITYAGGVPQALGFGAGRPVLEADLRAYEGWQEQDPEQATKVVEYGIHSMITVPLRARDVTLGIATFWRSEQSDPFDEDDVALTEELVARAAVAIDNARRYTREHAMAATLQRSLLPQGLPDQDALDVAHRYLPAQAGVGGDWFDVIPLPGGRVALAVGDVVGHGLHAAATMGRLRTAVHNFSALDLPPDELIAHLDELASRFDQDQAASGTDAPGISGASCLYAIYDPVSGHCTMAGAGHPGPAVVLPDSTVTFPDIPLAPPLGLGGEPIETVELDLPEGSRLALYTDGLIRDRGRDFDEGLGVLRRTLAGLPGGTPEETCQAVFDTMTSAHPGDDIALLVARTHLLDPGHVAEWELPSDPAAVARIRNEAAEQLAAWGLEDIAFTTELILSELMTNAIRYGCAPSRVRLLRARTLICEVADGSSTSPHLRRAATTDEGGRGLFLVAQYALRWGTRYTPNGKIIWAEQPLTDPMLPPAGTEGEDLLDQWDDIPG
ncbi:SpoIIE family protein phosphatase/ATP-binding protein [Streptomyces sp. PSAA01]|uniref:SpoIIE family protein phosphatase/ATP-binding protein n=1 Tax=Streptomyces sp. PSAA01 TaxID=2912762 RepID=UPI001F01B3F8|nr:SpoIIE family protein phosphatase/ATP-binding protein [Streptomyces sp. PSAA01]MCG0285065.1 SpoIIE family protein phosphatase [Streptomyces sp. PSAA01]